MEKNKSEPATVTDWDQHINVEIVVEKKTMLPHYLKVSRFHSLTVDDKRQVRARLVREIIQRHTLSPGSQLLEPAASAPMIV